MKIECRQLHPDSPEIATAFEVMEVAFAGMEGRIDPPSSLTQMTAKTLAETARTSEVWVVGTPVAATAVLTPKPSVLYVEKLAVRNQRTGVGRVLMELAKNRSVELGKDWLELESRVELAEVHAVFRALGFHEVMRTTHEGYSEPTSIVFRKKV